MIDWDDYFAGQITDHPHQGEAQSRFGWS